MSRTGWRRHQRIDITDMDFPETRYRAAAQNFRVPATPRQIKYIVVHITGGPAQDAGGAINTFRNGPASAHYIVDREGHVTQFVRDAHIANHVDNLNSQTNQESIGIEHVNQWDESAHLTPTDSQYAGSARLVAWLCRQYSISIVHNPVRHQPGIRGHIEEQPHSGHTYCPNPAWDWERYIPMVSRVRVESFHQLITALASGH